MIIFEQCVIVAAAFVNTAIALYIFLQKPRSTLHRAFLFFGIGAALWGGGIGLLSFAVPIHIEKWIFLGGGMMSVSFFMLSCVLARRERLSWIESVAAAIFVASFAGIPFGLYVTGTAASGKHVAAVFGPYGEPYLGAIFGYMLFGLLRLVATARTLPRSRRPPVYYFLLGAAIFIACMALFDIVLPIVGIADFNFLGPLSLLAFVGITAYAIVRHRLLDIRLVIQRGLIYSLLLILVVGFYLFLVHAIGFIVARRSADILWSAGIATVAGVFGVPFIERQFRRLTDGIFFKDRYDYALALRTLTEILHTSADFEELIERVQKTLADILRARFARIVLRGERPASAPEDMFEPDLSEGTMLYNRILLDNEEIGAVIVGAKRSGDRYTDEDVQLLQTFSLQAATALARARLFRQVREYALELENKVASRTEELRQAQEGQKQMMLDIAHGLQTPLTVFQMKLEKLRSTGQTDIDVDAFERSLMDLSGFIDNLLTLAELENRTSHARFDRFSLSALAEEIAEEVGIVAISRGIRVVREIAPDIELSGDVNELRSAIMNLASNAVKYMPAAGKREIRFVLARHGGYALLSIRDTGIGISAGDLPHIFDRFYRVSNPGGIGGSGLGLAIAKKIFETHGATLSATSAAGAGVEMTVCFSARGA